MKELIKEIKIKLNIEGGVYIDAELESIIKEIEPKNYLEFFMELSGTHEYAKPIDRVANVAKKYRKVIINQDLTQVKKLISLVHSLHDDVYKQSQHQSICFLEALTHLRFTYKNEDGIDTTQRAILILDLVKPHYNYKKLIEEIHTYADGTAEEIAFKTALENSRKSTNEITNPIEKNKILSRRTSS